MTTDSRKIQLETGVDATGAKAGFQQVKDAAKDMASSVAQAGKEAAKGVDGIGDGASAASAKVDRATSNLVGSIQRATAAAEAGKKSGSAFFESLAGQRGVNVDALKPYLTQLDAAIAKSKALENAAVPSLQKVGVSAAQTAAALRGVPAQFTDIVTSLQGGQAPLTVLLQQGGQLKDMFGGIGPAAKALGGYVAGLINPFTLAAAAAVGLGAAFYSATSRTQEFNKALITTGNYVGKSASDLTDLSKAISDSIGTQGQAADALSALAGSGKIAGDSLRIVGEAVVAQNKAMGTSIEEAVGQFVKLGEEPTKASAKLNESLHYLNQTTYDRIRALEEQGDKEGAAALAQDAYAKATIERMNQVINQTGLLSKALSGTKDVAMGMWNAVSGALASIGAQQSNAEKLIDAQRKVSFLQQNGSTPEALAAARGDVASISRQALRDQENVYAQGQKARDDAAKISASDRLNTLTKEVQTNADKRKKAIAELNRDYQTLGKVASGKEYDTLVANINEKFKDPKEAKGPREKAFQDDAATKMLESLRQQEATLKEQLSTDEKLTASEKERAKFTQLVADLKTKGTLTAEQKSLLLAQDSIKAQLDKNVAIEKEIEGKKEAAKLDEKRLAFEKQMQGITLSYQSANDSRAEQYDRTLSTVGLGTRARQEVEAQKSIRKEFDRYVLQANKQASDASTPTFDAFNTDAYKNKIVELKGALNDALAAQKDFYAKEKAAREDWSNGAKSALADYVDYVNDAASRARSLLSNSLNGFSDSLTEAIYGDKGASFKQLGENIAKQITKGIVEQQITKPIAEWLQGAVSDKESIFSKVFGGLTSNKESGESWLGMLGLGGGKSGAGAAARGSSMANPLYVQTVGGSFGGAANDSGSGVSGLLGGLFGGMSNGAATTAANSMSGDSLDNLINLKGGWGTVAGFANGGDPPVGRVSLVGERGPELFIPRSAGTIVPNHALGGGNTNVVNVNFDGRVDRETANQLANRLSLEQRRARRLA
jgi:lambda family phage tail tape measure protein